MSVKIIKIGNKKKIIEDKNNIADCKLKLSEFADMTFPELDLHIDKTVVDLETSKVYLKELSFAVLGFMKLYIKKTKMDKKKEENL